MLSPLKEWCAQGGRRGGGWIFGESPCILVLRAARGFLGSPGPRAGALLTSAHPQVLTSNTDPSRPQRKRGGCQAARASRLGWVTQCELLHVGVRPWRKFSPDTELIPSWGWRPGLRLQHLPVLYGFQVRNRSEPGIQGLQPGSHLGEPGGPCPLPWGVGEGRAGSAREQGSRQTSQPTASGGWGAGTVSSRLWVHHAHLDHGSLLWLREGHTPSWGLSFLSCKIEHPLRGPQSLLEAKRIRGEASGPPSWTVGEGLGEVGEGDKSQAKQGHLQSESVSSLPTGSHAHGP